MKVLYPAARPTQRQNPEQLALRIARHSICPHCGCPGLRPSPGLTVVLDDIGTGSSIGGLDLYGSDDDDDGPLSYLDTCSCGHTVKEHTEDSLHIGNEEFARQGRVAFRLDELLQDVGRLPDFDYEDDDIVSLRQQMRLPISLVSPTLQTFPIHSQSRPTSPDSSILSDVPPTKKRRISSSSLSDADEDDDEDDDDEDTPLAGMLPKTGRRSEKSSRHISGQRSGKKGPGIKSKPQTALPSQSSADVGSVPNSGVNGHEHKVKVEDKMDEVQLTRLATGVPVDTGQPSAAPTQKVEKAAVTELRKGIVQITAVENDKQPRSLIILTGLKTLFQKQLPKMPREYIARLVYDANSKALAIIKRGYKVVGGICYRPFPHRGFAEIVFFATASVDQVKGYGGMLMDHFKAHIRRTYPDMMHFLTYADNYAVGYFEKQGFSKEITLDRFVWAGYIKDYEGGTIMQCTMLKKVDYLQKTNIIAQQQEAVMAKIREMSRSHVVYPGLPQFQNGNPGGIIVDPRHVPGLKESGWTPLMTSNALRANPKTAEHNFMERLLREMQGHPQAWPFLQPVSKDDVADYYDVITNPMDLNTMEHKLDHNQYPNLDAFVEDAMLIFRNCRTYNPEGTVYAKNAVKLEKFLKDQLAGRLKKEE